MMKHESATQPMPIGGLSGHVPRSMTPTLKRGLWRNRSVSETPACSRSPITKAFDFLPWARSKKSAEKHQHQQQQKQRTAPTTADGNDAAAANTNTAAAAAADEKKDSGPHYHRNIFRSGGGIIRDILGDKLNKEKATGGHTIANAPPKKPNQRKPKQVVARNKSLDINELITNVEHELAAAKHKGGRSHFMDDTFIENIMRAKEAYQHSNNLADDAADADADGYPYADEATDPADDYYQQAADGYSFQREDNHTRNTGRTCAAGLANTSAGNTSPKHILFNDENTVYLIKKELPVKREMKAMRKMSPNYGANGQHQHQQKQQQQQLKNERSDSVLKARLKFKKLTPDGTPLPERNSASQMLTTNQAFNGLSGGGIYATLPNQRNYAAARAAVDSGDGVREATSGGKRSILQRQNTTPVGGGGSSCAALLTSPELRRRQHQLYQRGEQRAQLQRRKSLTDSSYEQTQFEKSSSSSSMGSGGSLLADRPKSDKPRKKLSFREPVVAEKERTRRRSSPLQRPLSAPDGHENSHTFNAAVGDGAGMGVHGGINGAAIGSTNNASCDNWSAVRHDNRYASGHPVAMDTVACGYEDNMDLTLHLESQAMRIVRTVGQAFEVCHKFNLHKNSLDHHDERSDVSSELLDVEHIAERNELSDDEVAKKDQLAAATEPKPPQRPNHLELLPQSNLNMRKSPSLLTPDEDKSPTTPSSPSREVHKLKDQLEQQAMQTRQALAQLMLVREQLISETNARIEAQARTQQLLQQNRELLEHLASLGAYSEQQTTGLTSANIGMAPQSQLQMLLQATGNNNNLATINQQISNLGSINQQLTSLSHQLSGLNQQSQNLQNFQNINAGLQQTSQQLHQQQQHQQQQQALTPPTPAASLHQSQLHLNVATPTTANNSNSNSNAIGVSSASALSTSPYPSMNQLQSISSQLQQMNAQSAQHQQDALSKDLFQVNQELLNRLQALNLGAGNTNANALTLNGSPLPSAQQTPSPHSSFFFVNPMSCSPSNNNNSASNFNFLSTASSLAGNLTPSPMGTLNRNSYTHSPQPHDDLGLSIDKNLNSLDEQLMKPLAGQLSAAASNGNIASTSGTRENSRSSSTVDSPSSPRGRNNNEPRFNTVMLKVTDEAGNVTNQRKLSATPSFIQRSTSEKVPNRSQMMSQVQRTAWARHTTK